MFRAATTRHSYSSVRFATSQRWSAAAVALCVVLWGLAGELNAQTPTPPAGAPPGLPGTKPVRKDGETLPETLVTFPGGIVWQTVLTAPPAQPPAFDETRGYVLLRDDTLVAFHLDTGAIEWTQPQTSSVAPTAAGGLVIGARDSDVWARDAATGELRWEQNAGAPVTTPVVSGPGFLILGTAAADLVCFNLADGTERWRSRQRANATAAPVLMGGRLFAGLLDGHVVALDMATGNPVWSQAFTGSVTAMTAADSRLYVGSSDNYLYVLDAKDGVRRWKWRTGGDLIGEAAQDTKRVYYVSLDNTLRAHDRRNGRLAWQQNLTSRPTGGPLWIGDRVIVAGVAPEIRAFNLTDGEPAGVVGVPARVIHRPFLVASAGDVPARLVVVSGSQVQAIGQTVEPPLVPLDLLPGVKLAPEVNKAKPPVVPMLAGTRVVPALPYQPAGGGMSDGAGSGSSW